MTCDRSDRALERCPHLSRWIHFLILSGEARGGDTGDGVIGESNKDVLIEPDCSDNLLVLHLAGR